MEQNCLEFEVGTSNSIWYRFTASSNGLIDLSTTGNFDSVLSIWSGCSSGPPCVHPTQLACNDDGGEFLTSRIDNFAADAGTTYWIKVADFDTDPSPGMPEVELDFSFRPNAPFAEITAPADLACACSSTPVTGTADAAGEFAEWRLEYQPLGAAIWTLIAGDEAPADDEQLAIWSTGSLAEGHYLLRLTAENLAGATASDVVVVFVDDEFATADFHKPVNGAVVGGNICVAGSAFDEQCFDHYTVSFRPTGGSFGPVSPAQPQYFNPVQSGALVPDGWDASDLADGNYELRLTGRTECNQVQTDTIALVIDNTAPVAEITEPSACESVGDHVHVMGTAMDANLARWELQYTGGDASGWVTIASGETPQDNALLGVWDASALPACAYTLRLVVTDEAVVDCRGPHVSEYLLSIDVGDLCPVDLDGDGDQDLLDYSDFQNCHTGPLP